MSPAAKTTAYRPPDRREAAVKRLWGLLYGASVATLAPQAGAADPESEPRVISGFHALDRPTGIAEAGFGWLTLPGAKVCSQGGCKAGDTSFELDAWQLYRQNLRWRSGRPTLGVDSTTDAPSRDPVGIRAQHSRKYLTLEGMCATTRTSPKIGILGRPHRRPGRVERFAFSGGRLRQPLIGPSGVTIRTEGGTLGIALGRGLPADAALVRGARPLWQLGSYRTPQRKTRSKTNASVKLAVTRSSRRSSTSPTESHCERFFTLKMPPHQRQQLRDALEDQRQKSE